MNLDGSLRKRDQLMQNDWEKEVKMLHGLGV